MYAHYSNTPSPLPSPSQFINSDMSYYYYHYINNNNNNSNCSSGYSSYGGSPSPTSVASPNLIHMSPSSHSFNNGTHHPLSALFPEFNDSDDAPVRRVCITGHLQDLRIKGMQHSDHTDITLSSESNIIIEGMSRVCRYSPEEKKVRIERYRSKRNHRNFNKKIKYACRKTLADSRPRIRGRFARNDEIGKSNTVQWSQIGGGEEEDDEDENLVTTLDSLVAANFAQESQDSSSFGLLY